MQCLREHERKARALHLPRVTTCYNFRSVWRFPLMARGQYEYLSAFRL